jgi:hypothetical protein
MGVFMGVLVSVVGSGLAGFGEEIAKDELGLFGFSKGPGSLGRFQALTPGGHDFAQEFVQLDLSGNGETIHMQVNELGKFADFS